jgi:KaiC/GvpD/RAD55 family RecA-like ATPase
MAELTRWRNLLDVAGERLEMPWDAWFDELSAVRPFEGPEKHPGWSAAAFSDDRRGKARVERVTAAVLDYDGTEGLDRAVEIWGGLYGFIHTSKSHSDERPSFRVVLPLSRPVSAFEWDALWPRLNQFADWKLDGQAKDPSRFWYLVGIPEGGEFTTRRLSGKLMDPDEWLRMPLQERNPKPVAPVLPINDPTRIERRAIAYIAKMDPAIEGSGGHGATWRVAVELARGFGLDEHTTMRILSSEYNPRCVPPWSQKELEHKAHDASHKSKAEFGYRLRNDDQWRTPERYYENPPSGPDESSPEAELAAAEDSAPREDHTESTIKVFSVRDIFDKIVDDAKNKPEVTGLSLGHYKLDAALCGLRRGNITVLGARTSFGKTSKALHICDLAMGAAENVLYVSVEDNEMLSGKRFMASRAKVNAVRLRANRCSTEEIGRMELAASRAERVPFFVNGIGVTVEELSRFIRVKAPEINAALVVVDYIQRCRIGKNMDRRNEVTYVANTFGDAIKSVNAAGLLISQLKRPDGQNPNKAPTLFDLKESGDIENAAEHVVMGWLEETTEDGKLLQRRRMNIAKNKDGPLIDEWVEMDFDPVTASFKTQFGAVYGGNEYSEFDDIADNYDDRRAP